MAPSAGVSGDGRTPQASGTPWAGEPAGSRVERRKREVRTRVLAAAAELFDQGGVRETRVEAICERADVARRTFFNHFPTKQHVVRALAAEAVVELVATIGAARQAGASTRARLEWFFARLAEGTDEAGPMHRELLSEFFHAAHGTREEAQYTRELRDAMTALVRAGVERGDVTRAHPPEILTDAILGTFYSLMLGWASGEDAPIRARLESACRFLCGALRPGPGESAEEDRA